MARRLMQLNTLAFAPAAAHVLAYLVSYTNRAIRKKTRVELDARADGRRQSTLLGVDSTLFKITSAAPTATFLFTGCPRLLLPSICILRSQHMLTKSWPFTCLGASAYLECHMEGYHDFVRIESLLSFVGRPRCISSQVPYLFTNQHLKLHLFHQLFWTETQPVATRGCTPDNAICYHTQS